MTRSRRLLLPILFVLLAAACGQKSGVAGQSVAAGGPGFVAGDDLGTGELTEGAVAPDGGVATGESIPGGTTGGAAPGTPGATRGGTAATPGQPRAGGSGGAAPRTSAAAADRTGISDKTIKIGIHAPVTGAAPFPQRTFEQGREVYWRYLDDKGGVFGRKVEVVFYDDEFNPVRAKQVCQQMVEQDKVFLIVGGGGADQITACAQYANSVGVPYLSAGVNESNLDRLKTYFALSATYSQQSPLLAQYIKNRVQKTKLGIVVSDTRSFDDARASFTREAQKAGFDIVYNEPINKNASQSESLAVANDLRTRGAEVVYVLTTPVVFLQIAQSAQSQGYNPAWVGPGITAGLNTVATAGCPGVAGAMFFSPFPGLDAIDSMDPDYQKAYRAQNGSNGDDIGIALWGLNKTLKVMFDAAGKDMSRQSFMATLESGKAFASGVYPPVKYGPGKHFGGGQVHALQADCGSRPPVYKTIARFASGF